MSSSPAHIQVDAEQSGDGASRRSQGFSSLRLVTSALGRRAPTVGSIDDAHAIVVFDFGAGRRSTPGATNEALAGVVEQLPSLPVLAQTESARVLSAAGRLVLDIQAEARDLFALDKYSYVDTGHAASAAARFADEAGWSTVVVVAHPGHAARCAATCVGLGLDVVIPPEIADVAFDPESVQWWTRNRTAWMLREIPVIAHHRMLGRFRR